MTAENPLIKRVAVAERVAAKFMGQSFAWGTCDCVRMAHLVVTGLGRPSPLRSAGSYKTERAAIRAMKKLGYGGIDEALDKMGLPRIPPAMALPGDLLGFKSAVPVFGVALGVMLSGGKCVAFIDDESVGGAKAVLGHAHCANIAWRVI